MIQSKSKYLIFGILAVSLFLGNRAPDNEFINLYKKDISKFKEEQVELLTRLGKLNLSQSADKQIVLNKIHQLRMLLKKVDIWVRYFEPILYKKINGPLEIEWENEVFEKFEKPYKREGAGLTLIENELNEDSIDVMKIEKLLVTSIHATKSFLFDSILQEISNPQQFILANRLFILNLSTLYTTGFECPYKELMQVELAEMLRSNIIIYNVFNESYPDYRFPKEYLELFSNMLQFVLDNRTEYNRFDHYQFIRDFVNPLFGINQKLIRNYKVHSISYNEYSINNEVNSIFDKAIYTGQDMLGVYRSISDSLTLHQIKEFGRLLFSDPLFSGNNRRACSSCHNQSNYFTDTLLRAAKQFDELHFLERNTPSLINVAYNQLLMLDGKHFNMNNQIKDVSSNPIELNSNEDAILKKILSCKDYASTLKGISKLSTEKKLGFKHLSSAISYYLSFFDDSLSKFDQMINCNLPLDQDIKSGFNLFMGKAQCATCHFLPLFNGVKPPFINSEFEVIGVPADTSFKLLSSDIGRAKVFDQSETRNAFRTPTLRNIAFTHPYMHNGVFSTLDEVLDFYNKGGGVGKGLKVDNQTLVSDQLDLSKIEILQLKKFLESLSENIDFDYKEIILPKSKNEKYNNRKVNGEY